MQRPAAPDTIYLQAWRSNQIFSIDPSIGTVAIVATVAGVAIPRFVWTLLWIVLIILVIIGLAWVVHEFGGGLFVVKLGHFSMQIGVS
jgi:hypothetical protein